LFGRRSFGRELVILLGALIIHTKKRIKGKRGAPNKNICARRPMKRKGKKKGVCGFSGEKSQRGVWKRRHWIEKRGAEERREKEDRWCVC